MPGKQKAHARLFYEFDLVTHIASDHLLRGIDRFPNLADLHRAGGAFDATSRQATSG